MSGRRTDGTPPSPGFPREQRRNRTKPDAAGQVSAPPRLIRRSQRPGYVVMKASTSGRTSASKSA